jgi:hypothetical protein
VVNVLPFDESSKANQAALIEAQKPFYTKRQEVYYQLVSHTATIGTRDGDIRDHLREVAEEQFWLLYWGVVPMVADDQVGKAVDAFSDALQEFYDFREVYEAINNQDPDKKKEKEKKFVNLRNKSMDLARACRKSLGFIEPTSGSHPDAQMTIAGRMGLL